MSLKKSLIITAKSPKSTSIHIFRGTRLLGTIAGDDGQVEIPAATLGWGRCGCKSSASAMRDPKSNVFAPPLDIVVEE